MRLTRVIITVIVAITTAIGANSAKKVEVAPSYAWRTIEPLGLHETAPIDTLLYNYYQKSVPSEVSTAYSTTGNIGAAGLDMIYFDREQRGQFFFKDALAAWVPSQRTHCYYNTRRPMTMLSYNTGGGQMNVQDRLKAIFSGNVNSKLQIGANFDYIHAKGSYDHQAAKGLIWGASASYIGERWQLQAFYNHWNMLSQENGGITNDLYITDPAQLQGGTSTIDAKSIPVRLTSAHSRIVGGEFYMNNRYNMGFTREDIGTDSTVTSTFVPVSSVIWTLNYHDDKHLFINNKPAEAAEYWENQYLDNSGTRDRTTYRSVTNTVGLSLLEGFNKYAKAGLAAYVTHELRFIGQTADTMAISGEERPAGLTPYPFATRMQEKSTQNLLWVGGQLTKQQGRLLNYEATAKFGIIGAAAGEIAVNGHVDTHFKILGDSLTLSAYGLFENTTAPFLLNNYISNHFAWQNDFSKTRRFRAGGRLRLTRVGTYLNIGVENIQNYIYFGENCMPIQHSGNVQIFSAHLEQNLHAGILHWDNKITYQVTSDDKVIPLPTLSVYSNLYLLFKVARVLDVQFGLDCDYYTSYYSPGYQPATMSFYNQREIKIGNYPFVNVYANMKLKKARFYVMFTHVNQGLIGKNYFSMPHYPLNPRKFQFGVSVDFAN